MAFDSIAVLTNEAKRRMGQGFQTGKGFQVKFFSVTAGGHDPIDPTVALAIDPTLTELEGFTIFGPEPIDEYVQTANFCPTFVCRIEKGEVIGGISSLGLWAEIVCPPGDPEEGVKFLFAIHNRPLTPSTGADTLVFDVNVFL